MLKFDKMLINLTVEDLLEITPRICRIFFVELQKFTTSKEERVKDEIDRMCERGKYALNNKEQEE